MTFYSTFDEEIFLVLFKGGEVAGKRLNMFNRAEYVRQVFLCYVRHKLTF